jgi:hypothetical protein
VADKTHVGWKTDPVTDDRENGHGTAVASTDGSAARGPRAKDGLSFLTALLSRSTIVTRSGAAADKKRVDSAAF